MAAVVVDKEVVEALIDLKAWMDSIPQERLEGLSLPDVDPEWVDGVIGNSQDAETGFVYPPDAEIKLLSEVHDDESGYVFKTGMTGKFSFLVNGSYCIVDLDSSLADSLGGMGIIEVMVKLSDITLAEK